MSGNGAVVAAGSDVRDDLHRAAIFTRDVFPVSLRTVDREDSRVGDRDFAMPAGFDLLPLDADRFGLAHWLDAEDNRL